MKPIERIGKDALNSEILIKPDLPIGTELWFMKGSEPWLALVAGYSVHVTAYNEKEGYGWYHQLFYRWLNRKQKEYWNYSWQYTIKIDADYDGYCLTEKGGKYFVSDKRCYFSKEALLQSL